MIKDNIHITGESLYFDGLTGIRRRYPDTEPGLTHVGGTCIAGILLTMDTMQTCGWRPRANG